MNTAMTSVRWIEREPSRLRPTMLGHRLDVTGLPAWCWSPALGRASRRGTPARVT